MLTAPCDRLSLADQRCGVLA